MEIRVNATRQELTRLKARLKTARRGHKLLKDKRDELMREFLALIDEARKLREQVDAKLSAAYRDFSMARAVLSPAVLEEALMAGRKPVEVSVRFRQIMNVRVPEIEIDSSGDIPGASAVPPYGFAATSSDLDSAIEAFSEVLVDMLKMAELEKKCELLAGEIEKTRRRVNALEYVLIPELERAAKDVQMRLSEMERANASRLMRIKEIVRAH
ncbi:MAG: V-type ATP synthase subunit D [Firmicutes bacterium]|nr:V-type ATP synthase subunit D [Candidatus Fermentithermobacillaceae bacterium]